MTTYRIQYRRGHIEQTTDANRAEALSEEGYKVTATTEATP